MAVPAGYEPGADPGDLDTVADVLIANELTNTGQVVLGADFVRSERSGVADLSTDARVVVDNAERIVGYGQVVLDEPDVAQSWGDVHPDHKWRGIGTSLLDRVEQRAPDLAADPSTLRFLHAINAGDHAAAGLLRARGLEPVQHYWHMQIELIGSIGGSGQPGIRPDALAPGARRGGAHRRAHRERRGRPRLGGLPRGRGVASRTRGRVGPPPALVRHVRGSRHPSRGGERRRAEPDRGHGGLRTGGDADRQRMGPVGAPARRLPHGSKGCERCGS